MTSYYVTTPIYYVNDAPHLGHAYATIAADALARFHRARGEDTFFLTGTDEHGQKIAQAAKKQGIEPHAFADAIVKRFHTAWKELDITNDDFIRTTDPRHKQIVAALWRRIEAAGDIYLGSYDGHYCIACEAFYPDSQLLPGNLCPLHQSEVSWVSEPSYFFRMSKYAAALLDHIATHPGFIRPETYRNEVVSFVTGGLRDLSISRTTFQWGIPVPGQDSHVVYVWLDALTNYISALGGPEASLFQRYWPASCHLIGKDILRFHAVYWPCFLMSAGLTLPETIVVTGFWTVRGTKIAKSMPATRVDPIGLAHDIGVDAVRYFLLREVPLGADGDFTYEALISRYNADLANDLGNLVSRTLTMTDKFCGGVIPPYSAELARSGPHAELVRTAAQSIRDSSEHYIEYAPSRALEAAWNLVRATNRYIDACQPWKLAKELTNEPNAGSRATATGAGIELDHVMRTALEALYCTARMVMPVMPEKAAALLAGLGVEGEFRAEAMGSWPDPQRFGGELEVGSAIVRGEALFPRIDKTTQTALLDAWSPERPEVTEGAARGDATSGGQARGGQTRGGRSSERAAQPDVQRSGQSDADATASSADRPLVTMSDVAKLDLRVATIKSARPVPGTRNLLIVELDVGGGETRRVVAGIAAAYRAEQLVGRDVIFLANLKPITIRGVRSEGMILAAGDNEVLGLSAVDRKVPAGTRVR
ncbi:MAG: methionine--tRNA ligase [Proteobacteria bacterium]|nr:methionine--tRNA ligase [Pseudomonadota bacterium]